MIGLTKQDALTDSMGIKGDLAGRANLLCDYILEIKAMGGPYNGHCQTHIVIDLNMPGGREAGVRWCIVRSHM